MFKFAFSCDGNLCAAAAQFRMLGGAVLSQYLLVVPQCAATHGNFSRLYVKFRYAAHVQSRSKANVKHFSEADCGKWHIVVQKLTSVCLRWCMFETLLRFSHNFADVRFGMFGWVFIIWHPRCIRKFVFRKSIPL